MLVVNLGLLLYMMSKQGNKLLTLRVEDQVSQVTVTEFSVSSLTRMIQILSFQQVGIRMLRYGISDNQVLADLYMDHIFAVTQSISTMDLF